jgi:hypothetical protein
MVAGDHFTIVVASGSGEYVPYDDDNTDGSDEAVAILYAGVDATSVAVTATAIVRMAEVIESLLVWKTGNDANDKAAGLVDLANQFIIARS